MTNQQRRLVSLAPGVKFPRSVTETNVIDGCEVTVIVVPQEGRLVAREVRVRQLPDGPPVTTETVQAVPVAEFIRRASDRELDLTGAAGYMLGATADDLRQLGPDSKHALQAVATVYVIARAEGRSAARAVEQAFQMSPATAGRWIRRARERGLLKIPAKQPRTER